MKKYFNSVIIIVASMIALAGLSRCKKIEVAIATTTDANLVSYMEKSPDVYSDFIKILEMSGTKAYLNAYGTYTLFAPTNGAIQNYLQEVGIASIESLKEADLKNIVRYHLLSDTLYTVDFTDGKLRVPTMYGEYLITGINFDASTGSSRFMVNRRAMIINPNARCGNGVLHTIDKVLIPSKKTLAAQIEANPNYSIFTEALKETGFYDTLNTLKYINDTTPRWLTVLAQSNAVYKSEGINNLDDLKDRYKDTLQKYIGYHILNDLKFIADLVIAPAHETLVPQEVITIKLKKDTVLANDDIFNNVVEPGVEFNRSSSDIAATNGVLHDLKGNLYIKVRRPSPVYWDVAEQPELIKLTSIYRQPNKGQTFNVGDFKDITWNAGAIEYWCEAIGAKNVFYKNDRLALRFLRPTSGHMNWIEFTTPLIVKGRYKVWICWRASGSKNKGGLDVQTYVDGVMLPRLFRFDDYNYGKNLNEPEVNAQGWKRYYVGAKTADHMASKLLGTVEITTTGRHKLKLVPTLDGGSNASWLDMIQFIPEDMDQYKPRFQTDGTWNYNDMYNP
jgi:uncharacterized surface protein with fasciclin (FAS1) repeats